MAASPSCSQRQHGAIRTGTRRWKAFRTREAAALVGCLWKGSLVPSGTLDREVGCDTRRDRERQGPRLAACAREDNARRGSCPILTDRGGPFAGNAGRWNQLMHAPPNAASFGAGYAVHAANRRRRRRCRSRARTSSACRGAGPENGGRTGASRKPYPKADGFTGCLLTTCW